MNHTDIIENESLMKRKLLLKPKSWFYFSIVIGVLLYQVKPISFFMALATCSYLWMMGGLLFRYDLKSHRFFMLLAVICDVSIVLILQYQRDAVGTVVALKMTPLQMAHVGFSTLATILYFPQILMGFLRVKYGSTPALSLWHKRVGIVTFIFRTLGFLLMFSLIQSQM